MIMERPKKIELRNDLGINILTIANEGYNKAISEYEAFLPDLDELYKIVCKNTAKTGRIDVWDMAEAINKRLHGGKND